MATILIAENEAGLLKMLTEVLRRAGYEVLAAPGGSQAIATAERHGSPIDLLITDIVMAGVGGADLYAALKAERPEMPVLFISGFMSREPLQGAFLKKPFTPAELLAKVQELLGAGGSTAEPERGLPAR